MSNNKKDDKTKTVSFGARGYSDYTKHKDQERKERHIDRHKRGNFDWKKNGVDTARVYSRWLLWNKPTLRESVGDIKKRYPNIRLRIAREFSI